MSPVVVVGLDAADPVLVRRFMAEGAMPTLTALAARGALTPLSSPADAFAGAVWPSLLSGTHPGVHGILGGYPIIPGRYAVAAVDVSAASITPFFAPHDAHASPIRAVTLDVPKSQVFRAPHSTMLVAWGAHAARAHAASWPSALLDEVLSAVGPYPLPLLSQEDDLHSERYYLTLRERLLAGVRARTALHRHIAARGAFDLLLTVFSETHAAGHRFWHFMDEAHAWHEPSAPAALKHALRDVYAAVDASIADLLERVPAESTVLVVSSHGMQRSRHLQDVLPDVVARLLPPAGARRRRLVSLVAHAAWMARRLVPPAVRAAVKQRVPAHRRQQVRARYLEAAFGIEDWPRQRAFCTPSEDHGAVRVNVRGREPEGCVEAGAELEDVVALLVEELTQLVDADSGARVVEACVRPQQLYPGPHAARMPDLVLRFTSGSPARRLSSPRLGTFAARASLQHRSAEHRPEGFVIAAGTAAIGTPAPSLIDIAPTVLALLGRPHAHLAGRALDEVLRAGPTRSSSGTG